MQQKEVPVSMFSKDWSDLLPQNPGSTAFTVDLALQLSTRLQNTHVAGPMLDGWHDDRTLPCLPKRVDSKRTFFFHSSLCN